MNEPLKLKLFSVYGQILHEKVLVEAWKHVKANKGCAGIDRVLEELGLELAEDKTDDIDFHDEDFDFLGFTFEHIKVSKNGKPYYVVTPSVKSIKKFKEDIKSRTGKTLSKSFEMWTAELNPILRGKYNYFLISATACLAVQDELAKRGRPFHGCYFYKYDSLDGYVRQRLRVNFGNRGKRHAGCRDGKMLKVKYNNKFFIRTIKLVTGSYLYHKLFHAESTIDDYLERRSAGRRTWSPAQAKFFEYALQR